MKILRCIAGSALISVILLFPSCNPSSTAPTLGNWLNQQSFGGHPRAGAVCFTIGTKAFVGTGYDGTYYRNDFWVYDMAKQYWDTVPAFPGQQREQAVAFSLNGKGYVGTGYNRDLIVYLKDFWQYDPATAKWTQLKDFGGNGRANAVSFDDGTNGYVGTGYDTDYYGDFWKYDADADTWSLIPSYRGIKRQQAMTMTILGKVYLFGGTSNGSPIYDMWEFDPATQTWINATPLTTDAQYGNFKLTVTRSDASCMTLFDKGYIATGTNGSYLNSCYQYDPSNLTFTLMTAFENYPRSQSVSFVLQDNTTEAFHGFLGTGLNASLYLDDVMEFRPLDAYVVGD